MIHFFNTHFGSDKFPMDPVIFTGRMSLEELKHDKPAEYEHLVATAQLEKHMVNQFPAGVERGMKAFGFFALAVGHADRPDHLRYAVRVPLSGHTN